MTYRRFSYNEFFGELQCDSKQVTGSMFEFWYNGKLYLIDCGLLQGDGNEKENFDIKLNKEEIEKLEAIIITHGHIDHCGMLMKYVAAGYNGPIYTTNTTKKIFKYNLADTVKVQNEYAQEFGYKFFANPSDVFDTIEQTVTLDYYERLEIAENMFLTLLPNAHIPGAAMALFEIDAPFHIPKCETLEDTINLLFTGDLGFNNPFIDNQEVPERIRKLPLTIICESTYGASESKDVEVKFQDDIISLFDKKRIIIPVCALNKAQEILYQLSMIERVYPLPKIYYDGPLSHNYTREYPTYEEVKEEMKDFLPNNVIFVTKENRGKVLNTVNPIIVTTSGMGTNGPAKTYIENTVGDKDTVIYFTSYCAEGTLGRKLLDSTDTVEIGGAKKKLEAEVMTTGEFSSHAKRDEIYAFLKQFENIKTIYLNHGDDGVKEKFKEYLEEEGLNNIYIISGRKFRIGPYGMMKELKVCNERG